MGSNPVVATMITFEVLVPKITPEHLAGAQGDRIGTLQEKKA